MSKPIAVLVPRPLAATSQQYHAPQGGNVRVNLVLVVFSPTTALVLTSGFKGVGDLKAERTQTIEANTGLDAIGFPWPP